MREYLVTWSINMTADNPEEAASRARDIVRDPSPANLATVWEVSDSENPNSDEVQVDLPNEQPSIHTLMQAVRRHPDYVFGTVFVPEDFPGGEVPDDFNSNRAEDSIVEAGNEFIFDSTYEPEA